MAACNGGSGRYLFIAVEGIDGVGKTTVGKSLASALGGMYCRTPSPTLEAFSHGGTQGGEFSLRDYVDKSALLAPQTRFLFYLFSVSEASDRIKTLLRDRHVVCDRYLASTLAYHRALDLTLRHVELGWLSILRPDFEFLLEVRDEKEWSRRLSQRLQQSDKFLEQDRAFQKQVQEEFRNLCPRVIDTTARSVNDVVSDILDQIRSSSSFES